jgi:hypothetical protein
MTKPLSWDFAHQPLSNSYPEPLRSRTLVCDPLLEWLSLNHPGGGDFHLAISGDHDLTADRCSLPVRDKIRDWNVSNK